MGINLMKLTEAEQNWLTSLGPIEIVGQAWRGQMRVGRAVCRWGRGAGAPLLPMALA